MEFGAHLPLMDFGGHPYTLDHLLDYTKTAARLASPRFAPTTISSSRCRGWTGRRRSGRDQRLGHHDARHDGLAGGRPRAGARGQSARCHRPAFGWATRSSFWARVRPRDYESVGVDFEERWQRLDEAVLALRSLWGSGAEPFVGRFYSTEGIQLEPSPAQPGGPPIWIGSWGSDAGLRHVARIGDGWLASAYNTTPELFTEARARPRRLSARAGRDAAEFPNGLATMWFYITEDEAEADRILQQRLVPVINRPESMLRERLPVGSAAAFAEKLSAFRDAGVQRVLIWPVADEQRQLELFCEKVRPTLSTQPG